MWQRRCESELRYAALSCRHKVTPWDRNYSDSHFSWKKRKPHRHTHAHTSNCWERRAADIGSDFGSKLMLRDGDVRQTEGAARPTPFHSSTCTTTSNKPVCSAMTGVKIYVPDSGGRENRAARAWQPLAEHNNAFWSCRISGCRCGESSVWHGVLSRFFLNVAPSFS